MLNASKTKLKTYIPVFLLFGLLIGALGAVHLPAALAAAAMVCAVALILADYRRGLLLLTLYVLIDYFVRLAAPVMIASLWDEALMLALYALWMWKYLVYRKQEGAKPTPLDVPIFLYFSINLFLLLVATPAFRIGLDGMRANVQFLLWFFIAIAFLREKKDALVLVNILLAVGSLIALHGCYQYVVGTPMPANWVDSMETGIRTRAFSIIGSPNILGSLMALLAPIAATLCLAEKARTRKLLYAGMALVMSACLVFTMSRGAWIGFAVAAVILVVFLDKRLLIPMGLLVLLGGAMMPGVTNRILYMLSPEYIESSLRGGRLVRWQTGFQIFREQPLFGVGLGHWGGAVAQNNSIAIKIKDVFVKTVYIDSYPMKLLTEGGLTLLLTYLFLIYQQITWSYKAVRAQTDKFYRYLALGIFAGLAAVAVHCVTENVFEVPMMTTYFWLLVAVLMHLLRLAQRDAKTEMNTAVEIAAEMETKPQI